MCWVHIVFAEVGGSRRMSGVFESSGVIGLQPCNVNKWFSPSTMTLHTNRLFPPFHIRKQMHQNPRLVCPTLHDIVWECPPDKGHDCHEPGQNRDRLKLKRTLQARRIQLGIKHHAHQLGNMPQCHRWLFQEEDVDVPGHSRSMCVCGNNKL